MPKTYLTGYKRILSSYEVDMILNEVSHDPYWSLVFGILAYMGLRTIEVCRIRYTDILGDCERMRVVLAKSNKIKDRVIPNKLKPLIRLYIQCFKPLGKSYLFFPFNNRSKNEHLQTSSIRWKLLKIRRKLQLSDPYYKNLNRISCHAFRHYFISQVYKLSNNDIILAKEIIGHKKLSTTEQYISVDDHEQKIVDML